VEETVLGLLLEDLQTLNDLGLTFLQAKVYLALLQSETMKAGMLAKASQVGRPDVYRTLCKLQELGLIEKEIANPVVYRAVPIDIALTILLEHENKQHDELKAKSANLLNKYKNGKNGSYCPETKFVFVPSKESLIKRLKKAINSTQKTIDVSTSCKRLTYACDGLFDDLQNAWDRGVKGRAIINLTEENQPEIINKCWRPPFAKIRYVPSFPKTVMAKYDNKEVFIFTKPTADLKDSPALWSNDPSIIGMTNDYFEILWITAIEETNHNIGKHKQS
jgi:sugar-specific transcriptional regulator TrmB